MAIAPSGTKPQAATCQVQIRRQIQPGHFKCVKVARFTTKGGNTKTLKAPMASLTAMAVAQPVTVKGLSGSSLHGTKLSIHPSRRVAARSTRRSTGAVVAKYGDKSVYFDLEDLGNTTGQWDLYGSDAPSPYNPLQSKFFETFAAPFTKRGLLLKFLILGGGSMLAYLSSTAAGDILPIKKGPQLPPKKGPRGKI